MPALEAAARETSARAAAAELDDIVGDRQVILRVDRIEPAGSAECVCISVGALTHSAKCLDIGLDWCEEPIA